MDAIAEIIKNFQNKRSRSLIVLATGTGKLSQLAQVSIFQKKCSDSINKVFLNTQC